MAEQLTVGQGRTIKRKVTLRYPKDHAEPTKRGKPIAGVYSAETLTLKIWVGDSVTPATLTASDAAWLSATDGTITLTIDEADTATFAVGQWRLEIYITTGSDSYTCYQALLTVEPRAGAVTAGLTYCTMAQVVDVAGWITQLITAKPDIQSNFGEYRAKARVWLNRQLMARARERIEFLSAGYVVNTCDVFGDTDAGTLTQDWIDYTFGDDPVETQLDAIQGFLNGTYVASTDAGLITDDQIADICAHYTAWLAGRNQIGKDGETSYQSFAIDCLGTATMRLAGYVARVYTDDTNAPYLVLRP